MLLTPGSVSEEGDRKLGELNSILVYNIKHLSLVPCVFYSLLLIILISLSIFLLLLFLLLFHFSQTNIGSILAAVNPYKQITGLYDSTAVDLYSKHQMGELPPHIFAVANECYRCLWKRDDSQCVLIR